MRFVISGSVSVVFIVSFILLFAISVPRLRTLYNTITASLGVVLVQIFGLLLSLPLDWFVMQLAIMTPILLLVGAFFVIEESPPWLMATQRLKEAETVIVRTARMNGRQEMATTDIFHKIKEEVIRCEKHY